jgi:dimeric dUTPase (all-alpha-NTP-PPase superfamily)
MRGGEGMELEEMIQKVEQAKALLVEVQEASGKAEVFQYRIEDQLIECVEGLEEVLNYIKIEMC